MFKILTEPAIIVISAIFLFFLAIVFKNYNNCEKNLKPVFQFLQSIGKKDLSYRFNHLDEFMTSNNLTAIIWDDFKKALVFPEKLYNFMQKVNVVEGAMPDIYLTIDSSYFFNEESLVISNINHKFIQVMPSLLTGLGPFFTFLKMAIAFAAFDFTSNIVGEALGGLMSGIQVAALCSVFAVGYSLIFMFLEKFLYNKKCKKYYLLIQRELIRIFDVCSSEQLLLDLLKESKLQGVSNEKVLKSLPEEFAKAVTKSMGDLAVPYLENILYSLNKLNEAMDKTTGGDVVDKLF